MMNSVIVAQSGEKKKLHETKRKICCWGGEEFVFDGLDYDEIWKMVRYFFKNILSTRDGLLPWTILVGSVMHG